MTGEDVPDDAALRDWLAGRPVLIAYGLLGDVSARLRPLGFDYMGAQQDWLRRMGARPQVVRVPTAAAVAENAALLGTALAGVGPPPALLIAHSKGGLEGLAALLEPATAARCAGFIAFQSPFRGTPLADWVARRDTMHSLSRAALSLLGCGDGAGLRDLTTTVREAWIAAHAGEIAALAARLPVVSCATVLDPATARRGGRDAAYAALVGGLGRVAGPNDGLVPLASTRLPGPVRHLESPGGHVALVSAGGGRDPVAALRRALVALLA
ncbi:MAG: hypothetical protein K2X49_18845 [Acetobacteraceae bacterium]|nr:hypothetical protein [Acetobacteraceae bacterium]